MPLHGAGKALADGGPGDIDHLARLEDIGLDLGADREVVAFLVGEAELEQRLARRGTGLGVMACECLTHQLRPTGAVGDLDRAVTVLGGGLDLRDTVREDLDDGHRNGFSRLGEHPGHAALAANKTDSHVPITPAHTSIGVRKKIPFPVARERRKTT